LIGSVPCLPSNNIAGRTRSSSLTREFWVFDFVDRPARLHIVLVVPWRIGSSLPIGLLLSLFPISAYDIAISVEHFEVRRIS
jgi:hypothetical protein